MRLAEWGGKSPPLMLLLLLLLEVTNGSEDAAFKVASFLGVNGYGRAWVNGLSSSSCS
jgi:hypothetical protein